MLILLLFFGFVALLATCWLWFLVSFGVAKARKSPELARSTGKALAWLSGAGILTSALVWFALFPPAKVVYQREFGESPSSDVTDLQGEDNSYYDSKVIKLRFQAAPTTIKRLAKIQDLRLTPRFHLSSYDGGRNVPAPQWWLPQVTPRSVGYSAERKDDSFPHEEVWLLYDPHTQTAHYSFWSID